MDEWNKIVDDCKKKEILFICALALICLFGFLFDLFHVSIFEIVDYKSFILTVLQIQATIGTLIFALIALISGNIKDVYMGVSVTDFYLNIRCWMLSQFKLIILSLAFCVSATIMYIVNFNNTVCSLFLCTVCVIYLSASSIYKAITNNISVYHEIECYVNNVLTSKDDVHKKQILLSEYTEIWKNTIQTQGNEEYEKYLDIYKKSINSILRDNDLLKIDVIQNSSAKIIKSYFKSPVSSLICRGVELLYEVYSVIFQYLSDVNIEVSTKLSKGAFYLFEDVSEDLFQVINDIDAEKFESKINIDLLIKIIQKVSITMNSGDIESKVKYEIEIDDLCYLVQCYIQHINDQKSKGKSIKGYRIEGLFDRYFLFSDHSILDDVKEQYFKDRVKVLFSLYYALLKTGQIEYIKDYLYLNCIQETHSINNKYQLLLYFSVHCYLYYFSEKESTDCISPELKDLSKSLAKDKVVQESFINLLYLLLDAEDPLYGITKDELISLLRRYEQFPRKYEAKNMILESVINEFYTFCVLWLDYYYYGKKDYARSVIDYNSTEHYLYNIQLAKTHFKTIYKFLRIKDDYDEDSDNKINEMCTKLEDVLKEKHKNKHMNEAAKDMANYSSQVDEQIFISKIRNDVLNLIEAKYNNILGSSNKKYETTINVINAKIPTRILNTNQINILYKIINSNLLCGIYNFLNKRSLIRKMDRDRNLSSEHVFMNYLLHYQLDTYYGSKRVLLGRNYKQYAFIEEIANNTEYHIHYLPNINFGLLLKLKSIKLDIRSIEVKIKNVNIDDFDVEYDKENKVYKYSINNCQIDFTKDELQGYLNNYYKRIVVNVNVSFELTDDFRAVLLVLEGKN